nr:response regulator transcription factor [uncultured Merdimonas sp.]
MSVRIAVIEDDKALREGLRVAFGLEGYEVLEAGNVKEGWKILEDERCDLAVLDCGLPDGNGFDLLRRLRKVSDLPVLMLTARNSEMDEVTSLELGVDDFMGKPFSLAVLQARVRKLLKRQERERILSSGGISVNLGSGEVWKKGEKLLLSSTEQRLLVMFLEHKGQILSKDQILGRVWDGAGKYVDENTLSVAVRRLRIKIEDNPGKPERIRTVHGMGYVWREK